MEEVAVLSSAGRQRFSPVRGMSRKKSSPWGRGSASREHRTQLGEEVGGRHLRQQREHNAECERTLTYFFLKAHHQKQLGEEMVYFRLQLHMTFCY